MSVEELNKLDEGTRKELLSRCCGATRWVEGMAASFPVKDEVDLLQKAEQVWAACSEADWREAFTHHPKIGDLNSLKKKFASTNQWAEGEQAAINQTTDDVLQALATGNRLYEEKFGYIFIVCATGKSAEEMLCILQARLLNDPEEEIRIAGNEQAKITRLRLQKLLTS
jgi:2-oxo-4-hydroxy-4-carboxy-5-ureidoimidazoline decarboxylase